MLPHRPHPAADPAPVDPLGVIAGATRRLVRRAPVAYWIAVVVAAAVTATIVSSTVRASERTTATLGPMTRVPVAAAPLAPGDDVARADVRWVMMPRRLLPRATIAAEPVGHAVVVAVAEGEVLLEAKLAPWGRRGAAALMPPGTRAIAVPHGPASPSLARGDVVDLLATVVTEGELHDDGEGHGEPEPTFVVAAGAIVVAVDDDAVTVAVPTEDATRVAFAITAGTITLALSAP